MAEYSNNPKNMSHVYEDSKDFLSVIITMGNNIELGEILFYYGVKTSDLVSRAHVLKTFTWQNYFWST